MARLPLAVLAASIVSVAINRCDIKAFRQASARDRADALVLLGTALGVLSGETHVSVNGTFERLAPADPAPTAA